MKQQSIPCQSLLSEPICGYDKVWFIGDESMMTSYAEFFQNAYTSRDRYFNNLGYIKSHFDVFAYGNRSLTVSLRNSDVIGRIRNSVVEAINQQVIFPKTIIVVLEDDLIQATNHFTDGISQVLGGLIDWLANEVYRIINAHKERLLTKARKFKYPHVLWVALVHHKNFSKNENFYRKKMNICLYSVTALFRQMDVLMLNTWDPQDSALVSRGKLTALGLHSFWNAIDNAFQKWDHDQMNSAQ